MASEERFWAALSPQVSWIHAQLRRLGVASRELDDVTQEVLIQVHHRWKDFDRRKSLRPWVFSFVVRVASNHRRAVKRHPEHRLDGEDTPAEFIDPGGNPESLAAEREAREAVIEALDALDLDRRALFVLIDIEETPVPEAAEALGIPLNTAYSRLRVARIEFTAAVHRVRLRRGMS